MPKDITLFKHPESLFFKLIRKKEELKDLACDGFLLDMDEKEARRTIEFLKQKDKTKKIAIIGGEDEFNRRALETLKIDYLVSPENNHGKDSLKQRASGFNQVLAEIAKKKNISIIFSLSLINSVTDKKQRAILLSRIIQNIKVCRKSDCPVKFATFAKNEEELMDEKQVQAIGFSLGMSSQQGYMCFSF